MRKSPLVPEAVWLFALAALLPWSLLFLSFLFGEWGWGLMDDLTILEAGNGFLERARNYFAVLLEFGHFNLSFALHSAFGYTFFEGSPRSFYAFKALEILAVLALWGGVAARVTGRKIAWVLVPALTLSFHYFYDAFFYLSSHEFLGLLFLGAALHALFWANVFADAGEIRWPRLVLAFGFLFFAFGGKEPFVSSGIALALVTGFHAWRLPRGTSARRERWLVACLLGGFAVAFALLLKLLVQKGYTSSYSLFAFDRMSGNLQLWALKSGVNHLPWAVVGAWAVLRRKDWTPLERGALLFAALLYAGYLALLLPWNASAYYATPLGLFFAFGVSVILAVPLSDAKRGVVAALALAALALNLVVGGYAFRREAGYQRDTIHLQRWLRERVEKGEILPTHRIGSNAMEASAAIPGLMRKMWGTPLGSFRWAPDPLAEGERFDWYVLSPRFHTVEEERLRGWRLHFESANWTVFRKP